MNLGSAEPFVALILISTLVLALRAARPSPWAPRSFVSELPLALLPLTFGLSGAMWNDLTGVDLFSARFARCSLEDVARVSASIHALVLMGLVGSAIVLIVGRVQARSTES